MRGLVRAEVLLAEVVRCRGVQFRGQDFHVGKGGHHHRGGHRRAEQIRQDDGRFGDSVVFQYVDGLYDGVPRGHYGIHEQHLSFGDVVRKPCVHDSRRMCLSVRFHQDFPYPNRSTAVSQSLFHRFARAYDRDAAVAGPILESIVDGPGRRHDGAIRVGQLIEALFDDEAYQSIGVELEVTARGVFVPDDGLKLSNLGAAIDDVQIASIVGRIG